MPDTAADLRAEKCAADTDHECAYARRIDAEQRAEIANILQEAMLAAETAARKLYALGVIPKRTAPVFDPTFGLIPSKVVSESGFASDIALELRGALAVSMVEPFNAEFEI